MGAPVLVAELDTHGRSDGREANSVAQYVLDRAAQQTLIAIDHDARAWYRIHTFVRGAGLDARILHDLAHEYRQVDRLSCQHRLGSSQLRQLQHLADQRIETLGFQLDAIELASNVLSWSTRQSQRDAHARKRRAQLVRHATQQVFLGGEQV